ncbi:putative transglutaminase elicitor [Plasmopara halstedii]
MVYSPSIYLISAAVAIATTLRMQQTSASSLYYATYTTAENMDVLSSSFPGAGTDVPEENYAYEVNIDPTLPDINTISKVPVMDPQLLTNKTNEVGFVVSEKVGVAVLVVDSQEDDDAYAYVNTSSLTALSFENEKSTDCATGWENHDTSMPEESEHHEQSRRLEAYSNRDLVRVEKFFNVKLELQLSKLPTESKHLTAPWPAPYWPAYQDSINVVLKPGTLSPAAKYATAFGLDVTAFMDGISAKYGIDSRINATQCTKTDQCTKSQFKSECYKRANKTEGRCIPQWFGICHAWSAAAIAEPEPRCPVTHNGVTFQPIDIKGLLSVVYDDVKLGLMYTGVRYRKDKVERDEFGRPKDPAFRDLNPAFFHIVAANLLGTLGVSFVADVSADQAVWNQPVRGFKVYEQTAMSLEEAAKTFYGMEKYPWNEAAASIVYMKTRFSWVIESYEDGPLVSTGIIDKYTTGMYYYYLLELDIKGELVGGEWVYLSDMFHLDFMWLLRWKPPIDAVTSTHISYKEVSMLLKKSVECTDSPAGMNGTNVPSN